MIVKEAQDWKDLQDKVHFILESIGLTAEKEAAISTPRGTIEINGFAIDPHFVGRIKNHNKGSHGKIQCGIRKEYILKSLN